MSLSNGCFAPLGRPYPKSSGYTLIEFIFTIVLLGVALALAVPAMQRTVTNNQVVAANNTIVSGLNLARSTAITTGDDITICPSSNGTACSENNWDDGWIVFNDSDADGEADADEIIRVVSIESDVVNSGFGDGIVFQADGTTDMGSNATIVNCRDQGDGGEVCSSVVVNQFGLIESEKTTPES
ncbi:MAG: GspH/FimT family pseudopilin [Xanthomonadales bacterium]|jgi:type IV fimbrial biogenesis protein FimT|nr:GspH/FimT family pseudopilin [Xanthomonadales bacterium]